MSTTFVPGYLTEVSLNSGDLTVYGNITGVRRAKNVIRKPVFGSQGQRAISGQTTGAFNASGHVAKEGPVTALWAAFEAATPIPFSVQIGEDAGATDTGAITGDVVLSSLDVTVDAEGEWDWSLSAEIDGSPVFTPAA
jgi:hypothetical protein